MHDLARPQHPARSGARSGLARGFGQLLVFGFDYVENPKAWRHSLELLSREVLPKVQHLKPKVAKLAAE